MPYYPHCLEYVPKILSIILLGRHKTTLLLSLPLLFRTVLSVQFFVFKHQQRPQSKAQKQIEEHERSANP